MPLTRQLSSQVVKFTLVCCVLMVGSRMVSAEDTPSSQLLMLGVIINEQTTDALAAFKLQSNGKLSATPGDLETAGIKSKVGTTGPDGLIDLDTLTGVKWRYDELNQLIIFTAPDAARVSNHINIESSQEPIDFSSIRSNTGFILNYTLYGASGWGASAHKAFSGSFDARLLTPFGITSTTALGRFDAIVDKDSNQATGLTRLESNWRYTDPKNALVYQIGDSVSGSLPWNSSWRFGGIQFKRNFSIRPDLITSPFPSLTGSTSVPSTLDLYLNNIKVYSGDVPAGPFDFSGLPVFSGAGDASIVVRDALGREIRTRHTYYFGSQMLGKGFFDFSTELGFPRLNYGDNSFEYDHDIAGSASVRYGLANWLTLEGHAEATRGLLNGGGGFITSLGGLGSINASWIASRFDEENSAESGSRASLGYQVGYNEYEFHINSSRSFGNYNDIGLVVDRRHGDKAPISVRATSIDNIGFSIPLRFDPSFFSVNFTRVRGTERDESASLLNASWSRTIFKNISIYATGYTDLDNRNNFGVFVGASIPIGDDLTASIDATDTGVDTMLTKSARPGEDAWGWSIKNRQGFRGQGGNRSASADYKSSVGKFSASVDQVSDESRITGTVDGALIIAGGGIFFVNQVSDAFAIVKGGGPNAPISLNGRQIATTNSSGRAFIPDLQSYQRNTVAIDPINLPLDMQADSTQVVVIPADRAGVVVDFGAQKISAATVILTNDQGAPLPIGAEVRLDNTDQTAVMGYDGRVWLTNLSAKNSLTVTQPEGLGTCHANFDYKPASGMVSEITGVQCH